MHALSTSLPEMTTAGPSAVPCGRRHQRRSRLRARDRSKWKPRAFSTSGSCPQRPCIEQSCNNVDLLHACSTGTSDAGLMPYRQRQCAERFKRMPHPQQHPRRTTAQQHMPGPLPSCLQMNSRKPHAASRCPCGLARHAYARSKRTEHLAQDVKHEAAIHIGPEGLLVGGGRHSRLALHPRRTVLRDLAHLQGPAPPAGRPGQPQPQAVPQPQHLPALSQRPEAVLYLLIPQPRRSLRSLPRGVQPARMGHSQAHITYHP